MNQITPQFATHEGTAANGQTVTSLFKTHYEYNGQLEEMSEPSHIKDWYFTPNDAFSVPVTMDEILHEVELNDWSRWNKELVKGKVTEISETIYYQMLNVLPPRNWKGSYFEVGEPHHHDEKGKAIHQAFWKDGDKYFTGYPKS